jgi:fructose-1,6-bisphosphatase/inositol monophosphatase family enzyme
VQTDAVLELLREVADELVLPRFRTLRDGEVFEKHPGDLVTVADREAEVAITARLRAAYPQALMIGEEACSADPTLLPSLTGARHAFTIDPVDGTKNFVRGSADFGMMVAELRDGEPVRAWIWQPVHARGYVAERGAGAWSGTDRLTTSPAPTDETHWHITTSAFRLRGVRFDGLPALVGSWVSCAVDYPQLVAGAATALLYSRTMPWDHAPGSLLVAEAGGRVTRLDGRPYAVAAAGHGLLVTGDPRVHDRIRRGLAAALAGEAAATTARPEAT